MTGTGLIPDLSPAIRGTNRFPGSHPTGEVAANTMRIFLLGIGPLPWENPPILHGSCHRTWQFAKALLEDNHQVTLVALRIPDPRLGGDPVKKVERDRLTYYLVDEASRFRNDDFMKQVMAESKPDAVIGANVYPACRACQLGPEVPLWADINGYIMGEAQAKAWLDRNDGFVHHFWSQMLPPLLRADAFSVCSNPQRLALIGELGAVGRLNRETCGFELVHTIPNARERDEYRHGSNVIRGKICESNAFVALGHGIMTVWWDVETSFRALERAMEERSNIHFVSLGGTVPAHDERSFPAFRRLAEASRFRDRFHFAGWVSPSEVADYLLEADVGYCVDRFCYEALLGARNRITEMLKAGLPPVTTLGTEITHIVKQQNLGFVSPIGDPRALADELVRASTDPRALEEMGHRGREYFCRNFTIEATTETLCEWARSPRHAPDYGQAPQLIPPPASSGENQSQTLTWKQKMKALLTRQG